MLTRRVKAARLDALLEAVEADQRLRLRRLSLRPPLLDREWPLLCDGSTSLVEPGIFGAGRGSLKGSRRRGRGCAAFGSVAVAIVAGGRSDEVRGGLAEGARDVDRGGLGENDA